MAIYYEWDIETWDAESGDVIDHNHGDTLASFPAHLLKMAIERWTIAGDNADKETLRLVLVRDCRSIATRGFSVGHEVLDRTWAYVANSELPATFGTGTGGNPDGYKVPARFARELAKAKEITK